METQTKQMKDMSTREIMTRFQAGNCPAGQHWGEGKWSYKRNYKDLLELYGIAQHVDELEQTSGSHRADYLEGFIHDEVKKCYSPVYNYGSQNHRIPLSEKKKRELDRINVACSMLHSKLASRYEGSRARKLDEVRALDSKFYSGEGHVLGNVESLCCIPPKEWDRLIPLAVAYRQKRKDMLAAIQKNYTDVESFD